MIIEDEVHQTRNHLVAVMQYKKYYVLQNR
jgi:hypothetical protein